MRLNVDHRTSYSYDAPISYALQQLRLRPKDNRGQSVLEWIVEIEGGTSELTYHDHNANEVELISIERGRSEISIRCTGAVEVHANDGVVGQHQGFLPLWYFRRATDLSKAGEGLSRLAHSLDIADLSDVGAGHAIATAVRDAIDYETGSTTAHTSAEEALKGGKGVCQDHAHAFCAVARKLGIPARYVSGYLMMNDRIEQDASHAWAEAFFDGIGWVGFDISNGYSPDERYIRVATGLDYRDAAPISGMRVGGARENVAVSLRVEQ